MKNVANDNDLCHPDLHFMQNLTLKPSKITSDRGYSCQTMIARQINEFLHPDTYHCWFSIQFNPSRSGHSSNPFWIYETLSNALTTDDLNNPKVKDVQTTLMDVISRELIKTGAATQAIINAIVQIRQAKVEMFRPEVWRIKTVAGLGNRVSAKHQYPEERLVTDLKWQEFDVIIE